MIYIKNKIYSYYNMDGYKLKLIHYDIMDLPDIYDEDNYKLINELDGFNIFNLTYKNIPIYEILREVI